MLAPIVLFTYNRLNPLVKTIESLKANKLSKKSKLYIFSDGPKNANDAILVEKVREFIKTISGFQEIIIDFKENNNGLANSIISGVSKILAQHDKVIVLEDDLYLAPNFLDYMNQSLNFYQNDQNVFSISGFGLKVSPPLNYTSDIYLFGRASSWGWGCWKDRWETIDWEIKDWDEFTKDKSRLKKFSQHGTDLLGMLKDSLQGINHSWAVRFCYNQIKQGRLTVFPLISKVQNIGFNGESTHCNEYNRYEIILDSGTNYYFRFSNQTSPKIYQQITAYYSIKARAIGKMKTYLFRYGLINNR